MKFQEVPEAEEEEGGEESRGRISTNIFDGTSMFPTTCGRTTHNTRRVSLHHIADVILHHII